MIIYVKTENSLYVLDTDRKAWERVEWHQATEPRMCECVTPGIHEDDLGDVNCSKCAGSGTVHVPVDDPRPLRTTKGEYLERTEPIFVGDPLTLVCEPLPESAPGTTHRVIITSPVQGVSYEAR